MSLLAVQLTFFVDRTIRVRSYYLHYTVTQLHVLGVLGILRAWASYNIDFTTDVVSRIL